MNTNTNFSLSQASITHGPSRASSSQRGDESPVTGPNDELGPSADPQVKSRPSFPPVNLEMTARLVAISMRNSLMSLTGMPGMHFLMGTPTVTTNPASGVIAISSPPVLGGTHTEFSLPGGVTAHLYESQNLIKSTPGTFSLANASREELVTGEDGRSSIRREHLPVSIGPDKTLAITNPDGTVTVLDPQTLGLKHQSPPG